MRSFDTISKKISEAPSIDFGDLFNESVAVFKKVWLQGFLLQLITIALSLPLLFFNFINFIVEFVPPYNIEQHSNPITLVYYIFIIPKGSIWTEIVQYWNMYTCVSKIW